MKFNFHKGNAIVKDLSSLRITVCKSIILQFCISLLCIFKTTDCLAQTDGVPQLAIVIEQHAQSKNQAYYSYSVFDKNVVVQQERLRSFLGKYRLASNSYHVMLSQEQLDYLRELLLDIIERCPDSVYADVSKENTSNVLEFSLSLEGKQRRILVNNRYVPELDSVLQFINNRLKRDLRFICFEQNRGNCRK